MHDGLGQERFGPYRILGLLGAGAMGEVSRAFDEDHERVVALKRLPAQYGDDAEYRERFRRESSIVARMSSPHVIPVHRFGEIDGRLYLDMQLVDGRDLGRLLDAEGALDPDQAVLLTEQIASALDAAHAQGLVHRDVKPSNVLVTTSSGREFSYLVDFGIARALDGSGPSPTRTGAAIGTLEYMAPERFLGDALDARSDVYSLACVLYECLTGRRPHPVSTAPALMHGHLCVEPPPPSFVRPGLPRALDDVLAWGLRKDPRLRCPTAGEFARVARGALGAGPVPTGELGAPHVPPRPNPTAVGLATSPPRVRRRKLVAGAISALVAGLVGVAVVTTQSGATTAAPSPVPEPTGAPLGNLPLTQAPAPIPTADDVQVRRATVSVVGCGALTTGATRSVAGQSTSFTVGNGTDAVIAVWWVDFGGTRQHWFDLPPGTSVNQQTFATHPWVITTAAEECVTVFYPPGEVEVG